MSVSEEIKNKIVDYVKSSKKLLTSKDIAAGLKLDKRTVDKAIYELIDEGKLEWFYHGGVSYVRIPKAEVEL